MHNYYWSNLPSDSTPLPLLQTNHFFLIFTVTVLYCNLRMCVAVFTNQKEISIFYINVVPSLFLSSSFLCCCCFIIFKFLSYIMIASTRRPSNDRSSLISKIISYIQLLSYNSLPPLSAIQLLILSFVVHNRDPLVNQTPYSHHSLSLPAYHWNKCRLATE